MKISPFLFDGPILEGGTGKVNGFKKNLRKAIDSLFFGC
jgi:hypothetical protein